MEIRDFIWGSAVVVLIVGWVWNLVVVHRRIRRRVSGSANLRMYAH